jgi:uncharacterized protein
MNVVIRKLDLRGREVFAYPGRLLERTERSALVEARFERRERLELGYTVFERGDRFLERFYSDRWYNIFEVHARGSDVLRGWYCNIARPAVITVNDISAVDLALDLWVSPHGKTRVLDEDEFRGLGLPQQEEAAARAALAELLDLARRGRLGAELEIVPDRLKDGDGA